MLEIPGGMIDPGEDPAVAAARELLEETGYVSDDWEPLLTVNTEPARHTSRASFFVAANARPEGPPRQEETEDIEVCLVPAKDLVQLALDGRIRHGVHVGAILAAAARGFLPWPANAQSMRGEGVGR